MAPTRPPEVVACQDCTPGKRCDSHRAPLAVGWQGQRLFCSACGAELPLPDRPARGCLPSCPRYSKRTVSAPPEPFTPTPIAAPPKHAPKSKGESEHSWHNAQPMLDRVRGWEALEAAADAWLQHKEHAQGEGRRSSPRSIAIAEGDLVMAVEALRALRSKPP